MLFEVIQIIVEQVNSYLDQCGLDKSVTPENIAILESQDENAHLLKNKVALSLLNLQEEATLKNFPNHSYENSKVVYKNSVINLNLYILFSANRDTYLKSLNDISKIIEFFQGKKLFTQANTVYNRNNTAMNNIENFRFSVELYTPTFEEMNFIWGTLGGRQLPSALYKISMIQIERNISQAEGTAIGEINGNANQFMN
jgi:Pvc16 N-terminal domain